MASAVSSDDAPPPGAAFERSATVILLDDRAGSMRVLMVERAATLGFAASALVFPGGKVDVADLQAPWQGRGGVSHPALKTIPDTEHDVHIAAIRELFEECGILLAYRKGALITGSALRTVTDDLEKTRAAINQDARLFPRFLEDHGLTPAFDRLTFFARWKTPAMVKRRFDTWFFAARLPAGQMAVADGTESLSADWRTPETFLARGESGEAKIIFPTARTLERLVHFGTVDTVLEEGDPGIRDAITPAVKEENAERYLTIPEGFGYPVTRERLEKAVRG
ncbi:MAG: NUDIX domain-containing protein [Pseudomonadota bacterium]